MSSLHEYHGGLSTSNPNHRHAPRVQRTMNLMAITAPNSDAACKSAYGDNSARFFQESEGGGDCWCHSGRIRNGRQEYKPCYE